VVLVDSDEGWAGSLNDWLPQDKDAVPRVKKWRCITWLLVYIILRI
jgi:hypothetical protein